MASTLKFAGLFLITAVSAAVVNSGGIPNASKWVPGSTLEPGHLIVPLDGVGKRLSFPHCNIYLLE